MDTVKFVGDLAVRENDKRTAAGKTLFYRAGKRTFDIVASLAGLVVLAPVFLMTAIAIFVESGGPVFYSQKRIGRNKEIFSMYKFRSMQKNADEIHENLRTKYDCTEVSFKLKEDPRITKVGKIIRNLNIDELPQLWNVVKGDMSIVGPRPLPDYEFRQEQEKYGGRYDERYSVPQGLTCYWQISDRSSVNFEDRMKMDVEYTKEKSPFTDFKLIVKTALLTITGKASY